MPPAERRKAKNPARRTFQAIRIAVNSELDALNEGLDAIFDCLAPGGRLCVITFHSLEDRLVKNKFRRWAQRCYIPPEHPICTCACVAKAKLITRKPIDADAAELETNRRSRSAKLRGLEKAEEALFMTTVLLHEGSAAPKLEPPPRPQVRAVRGGNHGLNRVRHVMRTAVIVLIFAVFGGLAISSLMSGATLMELNAQVDEVSVQLAEAQSEYDYLNTRMNDITSRASLQQVAEGELGLVKAAPSQITYVQLEDQSIIERNTGAAGRLLDEVRTAALSLLDSLNP